MKEVYFFLVMIMMSTGMKGQIVAWHFNKATGDEQVYDPTTNEIGLKTSQLVRGRGLNANLYGRTFSSDNFTVNGTKDDALRNDDYLSFTVNAEAGFLVSVYTLDTKLRRTINGPAAYRWYYSLNGADFSPIGEEDLKISASEDGIIQPRIILYTLPSLQKVNDFEVITFRLYAWGAASSTGSLALGRYSNGDASNSLTLNGTVVSAAWHDIDVIDFVAKKDGVKTLLSWTTVTEIKSRGFEVMRSTDGILFSVIDFVASAADDGNSTSRLYYNFPTVTPQRSVYYYRLRHLAQDGHNKLSQVIMVRSDDPKKFRIGGLFPNPASGQVNVVIEAPVRDRVAFIITDMSGKVVYQKSMDTEPGFNTIFLDTGNMERGIYNIKMQCGGNCENASVKFVKQ